MKLFKKIDTATGIFIEDVLLDSRPILTEIVKTKITNGDGEVEIVETTQNRVDDSGQPIYDPQYIESAVPQGFYLPKWDGEEWVEGGTAPDPLPSEPTQEDRLKSLEDAIMMLTLF